MRIAIKDAQLLSIQRPHVDLIFSRTKLGLNMWTNEFLFVPPEGRWVVIHESSTIDDHWKSQVPEKLHNKVSCMLKRTKNGSDKLRGMMLLGQPIDGEDASEIITIKELEWVRTRTKPLKKDVLRSIYFPILNVIELPSEQQVEIPKPKGWTWVSCSEGLNLALMCHQLEHKNVVKLPPHSRFWRICDKRLAL